MCIDAMSLQLLDDLAKALPMVGKASLHRHRVQAFANKIAGPNILSFFKKREEFSSDEEYGNYVRANIKPSVIVQYMGQSHPLVPVGTLGHFVDPSFGIGDILKLVQWQNGAAVVES